VGTFQTWAEGLNGTYNISKHEIVCACPIEAGWEEEDGDWVGGFKLYNVMGIESSQYRWLDDTHSIVQVFWATFDGGFENYNVHIQKIAHFKIAHHFSADICIPLSTIIFVYICVYAQ